MATVKEILERETFFDCLVLRHGFADYMRDYDILIGRSTNNSNLDIYKFQFVGCVEACYRNAIMPQILASSMSDKFVYAGPEYPNIEEPNGFIWGVRYSVAYPGLTYLDEGEKAIYWSRRLGRKMHEITLETEAFHLRLIFADIRYGYMGQSSDVDLGRTFPLSHSEQTTDGWTD